MVLQLKCMELSFSLRSQNLTNRFPSTTEDEEQDSFYTLPVLIGTPAQKLVITPDSGSADFWVWSSQLPSDTVRYAKAHGAPLYNPAISSTYTPLNGSTWSIHYGDGSAASGTVGKDVLQVGDITIHNQAVEIANRMSSSLVTQPASQGILGLAFGDINTVQPVQQKTPLDNMIAQDDIPEDQELFTCYLGSYKDVNDPDHGQSFFTFGKIDQDVVQASGGQMSTAFSPSSMVQTNGNVQNIPLLMTLTASGPSTPSS